MKVSLSYFPPCLLAQGPGGPETTFSSAPTKALPSMYISSLSPRFHFPCPSGLRSQPPTSLFCNLEQQQFDPVGGYATPPEQYRQHYNPASPTYRHPTAPPPEDPGLYNEPVRGNPEGSRPPDSYHVGGGRVSPEHRSPGSREGHSCTSPHHGYGHRPAQNIGESAGMALPPGWEAQVLPGGRIMFVDHTTQVGDETQNLAVPL